jgi:hypothetical protein
MKRIKNNEKKEKGNESLCVIRKTMGMGAEGEEGEGGKSMD